jgi:hypothetical protein
LTMVNDERGAVGRIQPLQQKAVDKKE